MANEAVAAATPTGTLPLGPEADGAVVALAAAARCRRLLKSVVVLTEVGLHDVTGVLLRSICEPWLVAMYAVFGGRPAIGRLLAQVADQERRIAQAVGLPTDDLPAGKKLPTIDLASEVTKLLEAEGQENAAFARLGYDAIYTAESHLNTHGGLGSILGHVTEDEASRQILDARPLKTTPSRGIDSWWASPCWPRPPRSPPAEQRCPTNGSTGWRSTSWISIQTAN